MNIVIVPAARAELVAAADLYELRREGLGHRFADAIAVTLTQIARFPLLGAPIPGVRAELGHRRRIVPGFPFVVAYRISGDTVRIEAVAHMRRGPDYWKRRVR